jgi:hypothetical protein
MGELLVRRHPKRGDLAKLAAASEGWLGGRDSNPDNHVQSVVSYR